MDNGSNGAMSMIKYLERLLSKKWFFSPEVSSWRKVSQNGIRKLRDESDHCGANHATDIMICKQVMKESSHLMVGHLLEMRRPANSIG